MKHIVEQIKIKDYSEASKSILEAIDTIMVKKLLEAKKMVASKMTTDHPDFVRKNYTKTDNPNFLESPSVKKAKKGLTMGEESEELEEKYGKGYVSPAKKIEDAMKKRGIKPDSSDKYRKEMERLDAQYAELKAKDKKIDEETELDEARIKIVKARVRGGKIQRRKKVSNIPGMTLRGGRLIRMSPSERRRRKMGQRKGKIKRRAKLNRSLMKRARSLRKREALGL